MRILHVLDHSLPLHSGYTFRTRAMMKSQQAAGLDVRAVTGLRHHCEGPLYECIDGLLFHRSQGQPSGPAGLREWREISMFAQGIDKVIEEWRPDILHAHSPAICGLAALRAARKHAIGLVYEVRAFWEDAGVDNARGNGEGNGTGNGMGRAKSKSAAGSLKYHLTRALENHCVASADAVFTICHGLREDLIARGFRSGKIGVSPNGVDLRMFGEPLPRDRQLAQELGLSGDMASDPANDPVIGFVGSFYDYEGLDDLISAMALVRKRIKGARLLLVGGGPMAEALRAQAAAMLDPDTVIFTGRVPHDEVERYYSLIDVLAYPRKASRLTDLVTPLKPLEAMAQNRLVAASSVGGHRELILDGETGVLFPPDDPAGCAEALADLFERRDEWERMRKAARAYVHANHDWDTNIKRYQLVYRDLLKRAAKSDRTSAA